MYQSDQLKKKPFVIERHAQVRKMAFVAMTEFECGESEVLTLSRKNARYKETIAIPLHHFDWENIPVIKVRPVHLHSEPSQGRLIIAIPKIQNVSAKTITITQTNSCLTQEWIDFVVEHLQTIIDNLTTVAHFRKWSKAMNGTDASFLLDFLWTRANKGDRFWRIAKSKVKIDQLWWPGAKSAGSGLFCTRAGEYKIEFGTCPITCWVHEEPKANCPRGKYGLGPEVYKIYKGAKIEGYCVPSDLSLCTGLIHHGFKVNLLREKNGNPTHDLEFEKGKYFLKPRRKVAVGEEFTYNYNYVS